MVQAWTRPTRAVINKQALVTNIKNEQKALPAKVALFAVVKADAYGHGAVAVAKIASEVGVSGFCVAVLDEAIELREAGIVEPILVLGPVSLAYLTEIINYNITVTVTSLEWLIAAKEKLTMKDQHLTVHLKIDTGMGRLGFRELSEFEDALSLIEETKQIELEGLFTHFATADEENEDYYKQQREKFDLFLKLAPKTIKYIHIANSATAFWHNLQGTNMIRFGVGMYGMNPSGNVLTTPYELNEVLSLESELVHVKKIAAKDYLGYGITYQAQEAEWIGTVPLGYADGFIRKFHGYSLLIEGQRVPIVGRIAMDYLMLRLPKELPVGTKVTIFGKNGSQHNSIQSAAEHVETINYEITCLISERVPRIYK